MRNSVPNQFRRAFLNREFNRARVEALSSYLFDLECSLTWRERMRDRLTRTH